LLVSSGRLFFPLYVSGVRAREYLFFGMLLVFKTGSRFEINGLLPVLDCLLEEFVKNILVRPWRLPP
jgi:hypothetical protein